MKPAAFSYAKARSLAEALDLLNEEPDSKILAGGQSLIATLNMRLDTPKLLIDINGLGELAKISISGNWLEIGALVRHRAVERSVEVARHAPLIARAMPYIAHPAIRNRGTFGGSIAFADPAAELPACIVALGAELEIAGRSGKRIVKSEDFFTGLFDTEIGPGEILTKIRIPAAGAAHRFGFEEMARRHGDFALVGIAAAALADGRALRDIRLVYFGVGVVPMRARNAEQALAAGSVEKAVAALAQDIDPRSDIHASGPARLHIAGVLLARVAQQLYGNPS